jgi:hypothetical protein
MKKRDSLKYIEIRHGNIHRDVSDIVAEIKENSNKVFCFVDDDFFSDRDFAVALLIEVSALHIKWCIHLKFDTEYNDELLMFMSTSGCVYVLIEFEPIDEENRKQMDDLVERIHGAGINIYAFFMFGREDDNEQSFRDTLEFSISHKLFAVSYGRADVANPKLIPDKQVDEFCTRYMMRYYEECVTKSRYSAITKRTNGKQSYISPFVYMAMEKIFKKNLGDKNFGISDGIHAITLKSRKIYVRAYAILAFYILFIIGCIILAVSIAGSTDDSKQNLIDPTSHIIKQDDGMTKYILSKKECERIMFGTVTDCIDFFNDGELPPVDPFVDSFGYWDRFQLTMKNNYRSVSTNSIGQFVLVLSDADINEWKASLALMIEDIKKDAVDDDFLIEFLPNSAGLIFLVNSSNMDRGLFIIGYAEIAVSFSQFLDGVDPDEIKIDATFNNIDTGNLIWHGFLYDETYSFSPEDWDV